ncbi:MAG: ribosome silencing factor [Candidatus Bipolaricaulia bacterium]
MTEERALVRRAIDVLESRKAENIVVVDLNDVPIPTSYFIIAETDNPAHAKALVNALRDGMPFKPNHSEGFVERKWIVLDYGDFVVHVFDKEAREFYDIESLWADHLVDVVGHFGKGDAGSS